MLTDCSPQQHQNITADPLPVAELVPTSYPKADVIMSKTDQINDKARDVKRENYLLKPVRAKKKTGENNFQEVYSNLLSDLSTYTGNMQYASMYAALVTNMFVHNATYTPINGHGKAQLREYSTKNQLQYFRSQGEHPTIRFHINLNSDKNLTGKCRMPLNPAFLKLWRNSEVSEKINTDFNKFNGLGFLKAGKSVHSHFITKIAHSGARMNNFSAINNDIGNIIFGKESSQARTDLSRTLTTVLPLSKKVKKLNEKDVILRTNGLLSWFRDCNGNYLSPENRENHLYSSIN